MHKKNDFIILNSDCLLNIKETQNRLKKAKHALMNIILSYLFNNKVMVYLKKYKIPFRKLEIKKN